MCINLGEMTLAPVRRGRRLPLGADRAACQTNARSSSMSARRCPRSGFSATLGSCPAWTVRNGAYGRAARPPCSGTIVDKHFMRACAWVVRAEASTFHCQGEPRCSPTKSRRVGRRRRSRGTDDKRGGRGSVPLDRASPQSGVRELERAVPLPRSAESRSCPGRSQCQ